MAERVDSVHKQSAASDGIILCLICNFSGSKQERIGCVAAEDERVVAEDEGGDAEEERVYAY